MERCKKEHEINIAFKNKLNFEMVIITIKT